MGEDLRVCACVTPSERCKNNNAVSFFFFFFFSFCLFGIWDARSAQRDKETERRRHKDREKEGREEAMIKKKGRKGLYNLDHRRRSGHGLETRVRGARIRDEGLEEELERLTAGGQRRNGLVDTEMEADGRFG